MSSLLAPSRIRNRSVVHRGKTRTIDASACQAVAPVTGLYAIPTGVKMHENTLLIRAKICLAPMALAVILAFGPAVAASLNIDAGTWSHAREPGHTEQSASRVARPSTLGRRAAVRELLAQRTFGERPATTWIVQNCSDSGEGSLRNAMKEVVSGDIIDLTALTCSTITVTSGALSAFVADLVLRGPGEQLLAIDAGHNSSSIYHFGAGTLEASGLTFRNGRYDGNQGTGGCVYSQGNVLLRDVTVHGCELSAPSGVKASGGGVYALGNFTLIDGTIYDNIASSTSLGAFGGGVAAHGNVEVQRSSFHGNTVVSAGNIPAYGGALASMGDVTLNASTFTGNHASIAGALALYGAPGGFPTTIVNCTISGNTATDTAGGGFFQQPIQVSNSTIASNHSEGTGGIGGFLSLAAVDLQSTILAGNVNTGDGSVPSDFAASGTITGANNLIEATTSVVPLDTLTSDPQLMPLAANGGHTLTMALTAGSPAIDTGNNSRSLAVDQRGRPRVIGARADIGAYEFSHDTIFANGFD